MSAIDTHQLQAATTQLDLAVDGIQQVWENLERAFENSASSRYVSGPGDSRPALSLGEVGALAGFAATKRASERVLARLGTELGKTVDHAAMVAAANGGA